MQAKKSTRTVVDTHTTLADFAIWDASMVSNKVPLPIGLDAAANGSKFMEQVRVVKFLTKWYCIRCFVSGCCYWCKLHHYWSQKVCCFCWFLEYSTVLANSGFKNKHIGRNLTLHPVTTVLVISGEKYKLTISTTLS